MSEGFFTTHGDEPVEARIVSWVLGEASAFEAAELERLCDERPELMIFKRRMLALHGLLAEAETSRPDDDKWELPPEKRRAIENILCDEKPIRLELVKEKQMRHNGRRVFLAIAACVTLTFIIAGLTSPAVMRQRKKSDVSEARSNEIQRQLALADAEPRTRRLETVLPKELIEGTPKPMNVPNLETPVDGPAGSATWSLADNSGQPAPATAPSSSKSKRDAGSMKLQAEPQPEVVPGSRFSGQGYGAGRGFAASGGKSNAPPAPTSAAAKVIAANVAEPEAVPVPDVAVNTPSLDFGDGDDFGGGFGKGGAADELFTGGNRSGSISAGKKTPIAEAPADMPVLGRLFSEDEKSDLSLGSDSYESNGRLSGRNTYSGGTAVTGGALGIGGSGGGGFAARAADALQAASGKVDGDASVSVNEELNQEGQKKDEGKLVGGIEIVGGSKFELKPGITSEYFFGDADLDEVKLRAEAALETDSNNAQARNVLNKISEFKKSKEQAKPSLTDLASEIPATQEPYSTFSLNISDASFQIAQAALAKGERPDPAGIKVEQFYNAVDYGDPSPSANEPVAVNIGQTAHPVIPGRNLVRIALKTAAAGRSASQPLRLTLLVDQSGSMVREDRRAAMDKALAGLSELLTKNDLVTVIGFSRTPRLLADGMTGDKAEKLAELVNQAASEGGTNLEEAIKLGEQLADRRKLAGAQNRIVLFTDGAANLGNADPERLAEKVKQLRQKGIAFDIAGIAADGLNDELLGELARNGNGRYYVVGKGADANFAKQLAGAFRPAAENVKVQVRFNPERVGRYKLIGFEKDRLKTEDFRNDKVDAAELAAEEAGVAIYQVETLPEGNGELGEVSVRFRDTTRGEMVERAWTIPHDTGAPVLDRATPSMQLAVLSMLAGEKLKGGPLADAIDFKQLIESIANVKQFYGNTGRVGGMLRVVDALK